MLSVLKKNYKSNNYGHNKQINKFTEDTKEKLTELNKMIQDTNDLFSKVLEPMKSYQTEMQDIQYSVESTGTISNHSEKSVTTRHRTVVRE